MNEFIYQNATNPMTFEYIWLAYLLCTGVLFLFCLIETPVWVNILTFGGLAAIHCLLYCGIYIHCGHQLGFELEEILQMRGFIIGAVSMFIPTAVSLLIGIATLSDRPLTLQLLYSLFTVIFFSGIKIGDAAENGQNIIFLLDSIWMINLTMVVMTIAVALALHVKDSL